MRARIAIGVVALLLAGGCANDVTLERTVPDTTLEQTVPDGAAPPFEGVPTGDLVTQLDRIKDGQSYWEMSAEARAQYDALAAEIASRLGGAESLDPRAPYPDTNLQRAKEIASERVGL